MNMDEVKVEEGFKKCTKCGEIKPISEFYKEKRGKDGLRSYCKECQKAVKAQYYQSNKAAILKKSHAYHAAHKEAIHKRQADYYSPILNPIGYAKQKVQQYRQMDRDRGFDDSKTITAEWFLENIMYRPCAHCGLLQVGAIGANRLNNNIGHEASNLEPCCRNCNSRLGAIDQIERGLAWFQKGKKQSFKDFVEEHKAKDKKD